MSPSAIINEEQVSSAVFHSGVAELNASRMVLDLVPEAEQNAVPGKDDPIRFTQKATTAHMIRVSWNSETGWAVPEMSPYGKIALEPTASVLHYATETFEGMKAYRGYDGKLRLFRPRLNCLRLLDSNSRVALPSFDPERLLDIISVFVANECKRWLPEPGTSLYLRPSMIGSGEALGISVPTDALFFLFAALFPQASGKPSPGIKLLTSRPEVIRAWPGGFGNSKVGASYGPAMMAHGRAKKMGCSQTLWLFGNEGLVTEAGASNFFVVWKVKGSEVLELVTCSLDTGVVLPGVTRQSVLEMARTRLGPDSAERPVEMAPLLVSERPFTVTDIVDAHFEGRLVEAFVSGTAMFIAPVVLIKHEDMEISFPMSTGSAPLHQQIPLSPYSGTIKKWLEDIIYGREQHEWAHVVTEQ